MIIVYTIYLLLSVGLTVWVARTLHGNGRIFLVDAFHGNEEMADAVNKLLVVGFYLVNIGFVALFLKYGDKPNGATEGFEYVAHKVGIILVVLGGMHFFNMYNLAKIRSKSLRKERKDVKPHIPTPQY